MSDGIVTPLDKFAAPWGREVELQDVRFDSGLAMLRIRIREGKRFTVMDVDAGTAAHWGRAMAEWARNAGPARSDKG